MLDVNLALADSCAADIGGIAIACDITQEASATEALNGAAAAHGPARILMNIAGIGTAKRSCRRTAAPRRWPISARVVNVNLIGAYNMSRLFAAVAAWRSNPLTDGERGVILVHGCVAAFDGQVGQQAYSASAGGLWA